jgi:dTDP-4-amino-4,6-dideoxygalactose transaminase
VGINAKMSELHAALGLCVLNHLDEILAARRQATAWYDSRLPAMNVPLERPRIRCGTVENYSYYPVLFPSEAQLLAVVAHLNRENIFPRRYFYPSLNRVPVFGYHPAMPVSESVSARVLCLPLAAGTSESDVDRVVSAIEEAAGR